MATTARLMTAEELLEMPDDGFRYELVRGELVKMAPGGLYHGLMEDNISSRLSPYVRENGIGRVCPSDTGFLLGTNPDHVRMPDVAFIRRERLEAAGYTFSRYLPGAPDLVVEVISPNDRYTEVNDKTDEWLAAGARMVVVVNSRNRTVSVHRSTTDIVVLTEADTLDGGDVVPGWSMPVSEIFE